MNRQAVAQNQESISQIPPATDNIETGSRITKKIKPPKIPRESDKHVDARANLNLNQIQNIKNDLKVAYYPGHTDEEIDKFNKTVDASKNLEQLENVARQYGLMKEFTQALQRILDQMRSQGTMDKATQASYEALQSYVNDVQRYMNKNNPAQQDDTSWTKPKGD